MVCRIQHLQNIRCNWINHFAYKSTGFIQCKLHTDCFMKIHQNTKFIQNRFEEYALAGTLGAILGSVFSGIHLSRARSALSMLGPFGFITGLAGYTCFRSFDSFSSEAMLTDNNRRSLVSGLLTPMLPYILLGRVHTVHAIGNYCSVKQASEHGNGIRPTIKRYKRYI